MKTLIELGACRSAIERAGNRTLKECWEQCDRGDWLLWLAEKANIDHKRLAFATCQAVRPVLKFVPDGEDRPRICIETVEAWTRGEATLGEVRIARSDAAACDDATAYVADTAYVAYVTTPAADAAYVAASGDDRKQAEQEQADTVRSLITWADIEKGLL